MSSSSSKLFISCWASSKRCSWLKKFGNSNIQSSVQQYCHSILFSPFEELAWNWSFDQSAWWFSCVKDSKDKGDRRTTMWSQWNRWRKKSVLPSLLSLCSFDCNHSSFHLSSDQCVPYAAGSFNLWLAAKHQDFNLWLAAKHQDCPYPQISHVIMTNEGYGVAIVNSTTWMDDDPPINFFFKDVSSIREKFKMTEFCSKVTDLGSSTTLSVLGRELHRTRWLTTWSCTVLVGWHFSFGQYVKHFKTSFRTHVFFFLNFKNRECHSGF